MTIYFTTDQSGVRFTLSKQDDVADPPVVFNARRIVDDRRLPGQCLFREKDVEYDLRRMSDEEFFDDLVELWFWGHSDSVPAPPAVHCYGCGEPLTADEDTDYQFDNALWIKIDGGYGMFIDDLYESGEIEQDILQLGPRDAIPWPVGGEGWTDEQTAEFHRRIRDVNRVVICHDCAHDLCAKVPWFNKLIDPHRSHAHRTDWKDAHPEHWGWDYDPQETPDA